MLDAAKRKHPWLYVKLEGRDSKLLVDRKLAAKDPLGHKLANVLVIDFDLILAGSYQGSSSV